MANELVKVFQSESFKIRTVFKEDEIWFFGKDVAESLGYDKTSNMLDRLDEDEKLKLSYSESVSIGVENANSQGMYIISESGLYNAVLGSKKEEAKKFKKWITSEVLPEIRKTGSYIVDNKQSELNAIDKVLAKADEEVLSMIVGMANKQKELIIENKKLISENKKLETEVEYKEDIIIGLVEDIDLATKRQRITQIIRHNSKNYADRYNLLYAEFSRKYHLDISKRMNNCTLIPKVKNKMDLIDRSLNMIPQLYELACKIFSSDIEELKKEWFDTVSEE